MAVVDVVIAAYNPGEFLRIALGSVIRQTFEDWACVVIDDGSSEDLSWVDEIDQRVARVRQANSGLSRARNRGIAMGAAPLVAFLDADDVWLPAKLESQVRAMDDPRLALSSTAFDIVDHLGAKIAGGFSGHADSHVELLQGNGICVSTAMVRRTDLDRLGGFNPDYRQVQDWDLWLRLTSGERQARKLMEVLAFYRVHDANMSGDYRTMLQESLRVLAEHESQATAENVRQGRAKVRRLAGAQAFDAFRATHDVEHLIRALRLDPRYTTRAVTTKLMSTVIGSRSPR